MAGMTLRSSAFADHDLIPRRYTGDGEDVSPELEWTPAPDGTAELALWCEDRDAPGGAFLHWLVTGIDPACTSVAAGAVPAGGRVHRNSFGEERYGGPRPPIGDPAHRYFFRVCALSAPPTLSAHPDVEQVHRAVAPHELASGTLVGRFAR